MRRILLASPGFISTRMPYRVHRPLQDDAGSGVQVEEGDHTPSSGAVGSGGETSWSITPTAQGTSEVKLKLWRQWEGDRSIRKRFAVRLSAKA